MAVGQKSTKQGKHKVKANKIFTDRLEPRKAFWDTYLEYKAASDRGEDHDVSILTYYGIGGIGKTTLLHKIESEIHEYKAENGIKDEMPVLYYDFDWGTHKVFVLEKMRDELKRRYKFKFPMFNAALEIYKEKSESGSHRQGHKGYFADKEVLGVTGEFLADGAEVLNFVPGVGAAALSTLRLADTLIAKFADYRNDQKEELKVLLNAKPQDIFEDLHFRFAEDLTENLSKFKYPLVIFLDTYEQLVNELQNMGQPLNNDKWLRSLENGLAVYTPNTIWVIAGRECLKWDQIDSDWADNLKDHQHIMGNLSKVDTCEFLGESGVEASVHETIYDITDGTPVYLDLCVSNYFSIKAIGGEITGERLGKNKIELMERFLRYTDDLKEELLYVLACIGSWRSDEIEEIVSGVIKGIPGTTIRSMNNYSFIDETEEGHFKLHKSIQNVLLDKCDPILKMKVHEHEHAYYLEKLSDMDVFNAHYAFYLERFIRNIIELSHEDKAFLECLEEEVLPKVKALKNTFQYEEAYRQLTPLYLYSQTLRPSTLKLKLVHEYAKCLSDMDQHDSAWSVIMEAMTMGKEVLQEDDDDNLSCKSTLAYMMWHKGQKQEAKEMYEAILKVQEGKLGKSNSDTQLTQLNLSTSYSDEGRYKEAVLLSKAAYESRLETNGYDHELTLKAKRIYAVNLKKAGLREKAMHLMKSTYEDMQKHFGATHKETIFAMNHLVPLLRETGYHDDARRIMGDTRDHLVATLGASHRRTLMLDKQIAEYELNQKNDKVTLPLFEALYDQAKSALGPDDAVTRAALWVLAEYKRVKGKDYESALELYKAYYDALVSKNMVHTKNAQNALYKMIWIYDNQDRFDEIIRIGDLLLKDRGDWNSNFEPSRGDDTSFDKLRSIIKIVKKAYIGIGSPEKADELDADFISFSHECIHKMVNSNQWYLDILKIRKSYVLLEKRIEENISENPSKAEAYSDLYLSVLKERCAFYASYGDYLSVRIIIRDKILLFCEKNPEKYAHEIDRQMAYQNEIQDEIDEILAAKKYWHTAFKGHKSSEVRLEGNDKLYDLALDTEKELRQTEEGTFTHCYVMEQIATLYNETDRYGDAIYWLEKSISGLKALNHLRWYLLMGDLAKTLQKLEKQELEEMVKETPDVKKRLGLMHFSKGDYDIAASFFKDAVESYKTYWPGHIELVEVPLCYLGRCELRLENYEAAKRYFEEVSAYHLSGRLTFSKTNFERPIWTQNGLAKIRRMEISKSELDQQIEAVYKMVNEARDARLSEDYKHARSLLTKAKDWVDHTADIGSGIYDKVVIEISMFYKATGNLQEAINCLQWSMMLKKHYAPDDERTQIFIDYWWGLRDDLEEAQLDSECLEEMRALSAKRREASQEDKLQYSQALYDLTTKYLKETNRFRTMSSFDYGFDLCFNKDYDQGFEVYKKSLRVVQVIHGEKSLTYNKCLNNYQGLQDQKRISEQYPAVLKSAQEGLASFRASMKDQAYETALTIVDKLIKLWDDLYGKMSEESRLTYMHKAYALYKLDRFEEALTYYEACYEFSLSKYGEADQRTESAKQAMEMIKKESEEDERDVLYQ